MLSKAHLHMKRILESISKIYKVVLLEEVKEGSKRYDFYFPTSPPICIEIDGTNHNLNKADGHFFKTAESLRNYKKNDEERELFHKLGKIYLLRYDTEYFPSLESFILELKNHNLEEILIQGEDDNNVYYQRYKRDKEFSEERKRRYKENYKRFKERQSNRN